MVGGLIGPGEEAHNQLWNQLREELGVDAQVAALDQIPAEDKEARGKAQENIEATLAELTARYRAAQADLPPEAPRVIEGGHDEDALGTSGDAEHWAKVRNTLTANAQRKGEPNEGPQRGTVRGLDAWTAGFGGGESAEGGNTGVSTSGGSADFQRTSDEGALGRSTDAAHWAGVEGRLSHENPQQGVVELGNPRPVGPGPTVDVRQLMTVLPSVPLAVGGETFDDPENYSGSIKQGEMAPEDIRFLEKLGERYKRNASRIPCHNTIPWGNIEDRLLANRPKLEALRKMDESGGEPDMIREQEGAYVFSDLAQHLPDERRIKNYQEAQKRASDMGDGVTLMGIRDCVGLSVGGGFEFDKHTLKQRDYAEHAVVMFLDPSLTEAEAKMLRMENGLQHLKRGKVPVASYTYLGPDTAGYGNEGQTSVEFADPSFECKNMVFRCTVSV